MSGSVSVIITTYNNPEYLRRVLEGYTVQSTYPDELIIADDGSGGETADIVRLFALRSPFTVRHVWQDDLGFRAASIRNRAIKTSSADYLIFSDGDCIPHRRFIEDHKRLMRPGWFVQGKRMLVGKEESLKFNPAGAAGLVFKCIRGQLSGCHHIARFPGFAPEKKELRGIKTCNMAVFRAVLLEVNGFNEDFKGWGREDAELAARLFAYGLRRKDPPFSAIVYHLWHEENPRESLAENDRMLEETVRSGVHICANGIRKNLALNTRESRQAGTK